MEFKGYAKVRIPQATVCTEQSTHTGGAQQRNKAAVKAGAQSGQQVPIRISFHGCRTGLSRDPNPRKQVSKRKTRYQGLQSQASAYDQENLDKIRG